MIQATMTAAKGVEVLGKVLDVEHPKSLGNPEDYNTFNTFNTFTTPTCRDDKKSTIYSAHDTHNVCAHIEGTGWGKGVGGVEGVAALKPEPSGFLLNVRVAPGHRTPWDVRLAHVLKHLKRAFGFEVVAIHPTNLTSPPETPWAQAAAQLEQDLAGEPTPTSDTSETPSPAEARVGAPVPTATVAQRTDKPKPTVRVPRANLGNWTRRPASTLDRLKEPQTVSSPTHPGNVPDRATRLTQQGDPMNARAFIDSQSNFLKAADLERQHRTYTIKGHEVAKIGTGNSSRQQIIIHFHETPKVLGLNKVNTEVLCDLLGDDTDGWVNKPISLRPDKTNDDKGNVVDCVRINLIIPQAAPAAPAVNKPPKSRALDLWTADHPNVVKEARFEEFRKDVAAVFPQRGIDTVQSLSTLTDQEWMSYVGAYEAAKNKADDDIPF